jgi:NADPH:quinone reductase-like Zn-dependent oxidoreductase
MALQALRDHSQHRAGQRIAITGATGCVGSFAVQIAKAYGAHVTAVCRAENGELARQLGADRVVDYTSDDYLREERYDAILDNGGGRSLRRAASCARARRIRRSELRPRHLAYRRRPCGAADSSAA